MSETENVSDGKPHSGKKNVSLDVEQLRKYSNLIKERAQFYREENIRFKEILKNLKLLNDEVKLGLGSSVENLDKIVAELEAGSLSLQKAELGHAEKLRKRNNYASKLKICIRHYTNLNENISKQIGSLKSDAKQDVNSSLKVDPRDIHQLEEKAKKYENQLATFEKKYPWLKNPDYNLPNIGRHVDKLKSLKEKRNNLLKELSVYQNL